MQQTVRVAAVQAESVWLDLAGGVDKVISLIGEAAAGGARLVAFPETFVPGYPWWIWLDSPAAGMAFVPAYAANSMTRDGAELDRIRRAAARHRIHVVLGFSERAGGSLYMAQAFISDSGELIWCGASSSPRTWSVRCSARETAATCRCTTPRLAGSAA